LTTFEQFEYICPPLLGQSDWMT